jgi:hypothetical protein
MRRLFSNVVMLMIVVAILGYCRDWYRVSATDHLASNDLDVRVHIDKKKVREDVRQAKEAVRSLRKTLEDAFEDD